MINGYKILTVTHHTTKVNTLGNYAFDCEDTDLNDRLHQLKRLSHVEELMYLATCNRITYFFYTEQELDEPFIDAFFSIVNPTLGREESVMNHILALQGRDAINHLFEVAASMNSMVVGEREILRQLREAYRYCQAQNLIGDHIRLAMRAAVEGAKDIYANTRIGEKPISIVSLAIQKLLQSDLSRKSKILLIGAGQTNTLVAKFLIKHGYENVTVFNRTPEKAIHLAAKFDQKGFSLTELPHYTEGFEGIFVCTGANKAILTEELYKILLRKDVSNKLLIDLAIPNNVAADVVKNNNCQYVEIDDLRALAKENMSFRQNEVIKGRRMIKAKLNDFIALHRQRQITKAMRAVPDQIKAVKSHAINSVFRKELQHLDQDTKNLIDRMMNYMEKQCISIPMKAAKDTLKSSMSKVKVEK